MISTLLCLLLSAPLIAPPATQPASNVEQAKIRLAAAEAKAQEIRDIKLVMPMKQLRRGLISKAKGLQELQQDYREIIALKHPPAIAVALVGMADSYQDFAQALLRVPPPKELNAESRDVYLAALEDQAMPLEDKARGLYQSALTLCQEEKIRPDLIPIIKAKLQALSPQKKP